MDAQFYSSCRNSVSLFVVNNRYLHKMILCYIVSAFLNKKKRKKNNNILIYQNALKRTFAKNMFNLLKK